MESFTPEPLFRISWRVVGANPEVVESGRHRRRRTASVPCFQGNAGGRRTELAEWADGRCADPSRSQASDHHASLLCFALKEAAREGQATAQGISGVEAE